jgi:hypothetical protein
MNRGSTVGIAIGYWMDSRGVGVLIPVGVKYFRAPPYRPDLLSNASLGLFSERWP